MRIEPLLTLFNGSTGVNKATPTPERYISDPSFPEPISLPTPVSEIPEAPAFQANYSEPVVSFEGEEFTLVDNGIVDFDDVETCDDLVEVKDEETEEAEEKRNRIEEIVNSTDFEDEPDDDKHNNNEELEEEVQIEILESPPGLIAA